jgi:RNA polymerase sigma factor (sigma-70 family)
LQATPSFAGDHGQTDSGLPALGTISWGSHFCVFYEAKRDLLEILVCFFKAGLEQNEFCLWVVGGHEFVSTKAARRALAQVYPPVEDFLKSNNIRLVTHQQLFGTRGRIDPSVAVARVQKMAADALRRGFRGLRWNGSPSWVRWNLQSQRFCEFEREIDVLLEGQPTIVACTFPIGLSTADEILDAARTHQFAVTMRNGVWKRVETADVDAAVREAEQRSPVLEQLSFRQREILKHIAESLNTKQIAALLGISVKTVEAHRLQMMRRLKIDNVAGLVRFAIRSGLVSAAA